jgi:alkanesulfonate monooxygenase SsuD/methylene tetrahydromethanopterin reductase-like flavin-dependent oxidoreductase (luciferase family)
MAIEGKKIGLVLPHWESFVEGVPSPTTRELLHAARRAEDCGFDSVWLVDHLVNEPAVDEADFGYEIPDAMQGVKLGYWECWTLASALAATTTRIEIGTLVTNTGYRNPGLLAQMVNTVEDISGGRVVLGLGAGDYAEEHRTWGYGFERRVSRFEEALQILRPLLRRETVSFEGEFYQLHEAEVRPPGPRPQGPPVLIGLLRGGPRMQRLVAQHADQWNVWIGEDTRVAVYREAVAAIVAACEKHGRDPATLAKNAGIGIVLPDADPELVVGQPLQGSVDELTDQLGRLLEEDVDHLSVSLLPWSEEAIEQLGEILRKLG